MVVPAATKGKPLPWRPARSTPLGAQARSGMTSRKCAMGAVAIRNPQINPKPVIKLPEHLGLAQQ